MRLIIVSGLSGSGKSIALNALEDLGCYCIDNIPIGLLRSLIEELTETNDPVSENVAVGLDARNRPSDIAELPELITQLRADGVNCETVFLQAREDTLLSRFSETRRKHPLSDGKISLPEALAKERDLLGPIVDSADLIIDTSSTTVYALRKRLTERVARREPQDLSIVVESFAYKRGLPADADFVIDVRCLSNPFWEPKLRLLNGKDEAVQAFLRADDAVCDMVNDVVGFLQRWIPRYQDFQRAYLTVAIGCTGGQHRSVYVAEEVVRRLKPAYPAIQVFHLEVRG